MAFPTHDLCPKLGSITGLLWENASTSVDLNLSWRFHIRFEPVMYRGEPLHCSLDAEFVTLPIRDWRALEHRDISTAIQGASSFCVYEHDEVVSSNLRIGRRNGTRFDLKWDAIVDFFGGTKGECDPALNVETVTSADFLGVLVASHLLEGYEQPDNRARCLLSRFLDVDRFGPVVHATIDMCTGHWLLPE